MAWTGTPGTGSIVMDGTLRATGVGIGMAPSNILDITQTQNAQSVGKLLNANASTLAQASWQLQNNASSVGTLSLTGSGYTPTATWDRADGTYLAANGAGGLSISAYHASGVITLHTGSSHTERLRLGAAGAAYVNDTANANMTIGGTWNQGASDDEIGAWKSSDIAHGITDNTETDTYGIIKKVVAASGGILVEGYTEATIGYYLGGAYTTGNTTKTAAGRAAVTINAWKKSGTGLTGPGAGENLLAVLSSTSARFIVDQEGDYHYDGADGGAFDGEDDASIARSHDIALANPATVIRDEFDRYVSDEKDTLIRSGVIQYIPPEREARGERSLVNGTQLQRVHNGAIWQGRLIDCAIAEALRKTVPGFDVAFIAELQRTSLPEIPMLQQGV